MTYTPKRDEKFYYIWDLMNYIEEKQCKTCSFSKIVQDPDNEPHSSEYPMCFEIEAEIIAEQPVEALDDAGDGGVVCSRYRNVVLSEEEHPDQGRLL